MTSECACTAAMRLDVSVWHCKEHGFHRVTVIPRLALLKNDADAYVLLEKIHIAITREGLQ